MENHRLSRRDFDLLAHGLGDWSVLRMLRSTQLSKHIMLIRAVLNVAATEHPRCLKELRLASSYRLLAQAQRRAAREVTELLALPHVGAWAFACLHRMGMADVPDDDVRLDLAYFNGIVAMASLSAALPFDLSVPLRDGVLYLPGSSPVPMEADCGLSRITSSGQEPVVVAGRSVRRPAGRPHRLPRPPRLVAEHQRVRLDVTVHPYDPYLDRFTNRIATLSEADIARWRHRAAAAWRIIVDYDREHAEAIAAGVRAVVPLVTAHRSHVVSATSSAVSGTVATSLPTDDLTFAETLIHEFQHLKLCALLDLLTLVRKDVATLCYAPWRDDPRPLPGLLQGTYAYFGVTRFWRRLRQDVTAEHAMRAQVEFARRRTTTLSAARVLLGSGGLTEEGTRFVGIMERDLTAWQSEPVPRAAQRMADETNTDHHVTWQLRHLRPARSVLDRMVTEWRSGGPRSVRLDPGSLELRPTTTPMTSRRHPLLTLRYTDPARFGHWSEHGRLPGGDGAGAGEVFEVGPGDSALLHDDIVSALASYRAEIKAGHAGPEVWAGLILAARRSPQSPSGTALERHAPFTRALHDRIRTSTGAAVDPLELADWVGAAP